MGSKKALMVASVASMIEQFNMNNLDLLKTLGYEVHVACNFEKGSTFSTEHSQELKKRLNQSGIVTHQINFDRGIFSKDNLNALQQMKCLLKEEKYQLIHCHSPIGGVITRVSAKRYRKSGLKVIYTAHGFHFFKGAPIQNWILFYPIEKWLSKYTDVLITINKEDYKRAKDKFHAKRIEYVPGIGIDINKFDLKEFDRAEYRSRIGLQKNDYMFLSVGELNKNKNHELVIRAIAESKESNFHYYIAGKGDLEGYLLKLAKEMKVDNQIHLLGFRDDVNELYHCTDLYIHPSFREGLPVALMEAMACSVLCLASNIRGCSDLLEQEQLFSLKDTNYLKNLLIQLVYEKNNKEKIEKERKLILEYDKSKVLSLMKVIYKKSE